MRFTATSIPGAWIIDIAPHADKRGFFARTFCQEEFKRYGANGQIVQQSISWNPRAGTLRGLHYQAAPFEEEKLVRATRGAIYDVIVDLRRDSPAYGCWFGIELSASNRRQLYIPKGVAHGFQTISRNAEILYGITAPYEPGAARGIRWDDPTLKIDWPRHEDRLISPKDREFPFLNDVLSP